MERDRKLPSMSTVPPHDLIPLYSSMFDNISPGPDSPRYGTLSARRIAIIDRPISSSQQMFPYSSNRLSTGAAMPLPFTAEERRMKVKVKQNTFVNTLIPASYGTRLKHGSPSAARLCDHRAELSRDFFIIFSPLEQTIKRDFSRPMHEEEACGS